MEQLNIQQLLAYQRTKALTFSQFIEMLNENPEEHLQTSATLISKAINYYGFEIVVRGGEPVLSYNIFKDPFSNGVNAVYGQEHCIKHIVEVIESFEKESSPKRGIVLAGPPASGKTNIVDLLTQALENYTKEHTVKLYTFYYHFEDQHGKAVEIRSSFMHNPILLFPTILRMDDGTVVRPRQELFEYLNTHTKSYKRVEIPNYYQYATLDKRNLDILETLMQNPRNRDKTLFDIFEEYVRVEELEFSNAQAKGIANIDDMRQLHVNVRDLHLGEEEMNVLHNHIIGRTGYMYDGAMLASNRGILHIHDAFGFDGGGPVPEEADYKPLLMLLGSGKISLQSTQTSLDNTVVITTNLEEMNVLEKHLASSKLLDRIEKIPVNYLLDAISEMNILRRDMTHMRQKYDVDPNLLRVAAYYSVMTRLLPPEHDRHANNWREEKKELYTEITPEQKLFIYSSQSEDPVNTIRHLPNWHPFRNECLRVGINIFEPDIFSKYIFRSPEAISLEDSGQFTNEQLKLLDDEFMRVLQREYYPNEGKRGLSIRQLQNIMRNTIANSDGRKVTVEIFLNQLERIIRDGPSVHHWLSLNFTYRNDQPPLAAREVGTVALEEGEGDYGDFSGLIKVVKALYYDMIRKEITVATVARDPERIEIDLRKYLQHALLEKAHENRAFAHILVPQFTFIDPETGEKVEIPNINFMQSIEKVISEDDTDSAEFRLEMGQKFLDLHDSGEIVLAEGKSIVTSRDDNLVNCFLKEYTVLLSHRKAVEGISPESLRDAFFHRQNAPEQYEKCTPEIKELADQILRNMITRFGYSREIALDTIVYSLRNGIIDFDRMIN